MEQEHQHQHQPPAAGDDVVVQLSASAVAAVDERSSTATGNEDDDDDANAAGKSRRTFSQSYKMAHRKPQEFTWFQALGLAYQSLGIVYGDLGTSPLYVFSTVKLEDPSKDDFLGLLSLILWTLVSIAFVKYTFIVLHADDHGEGGTFALYSLLRQHVNFKGNMPVPVTQLESDVNLKYHSKKSKLPSKMLEFLERSTAAQVIITGIVLCATSMVMGDGALTPAISGTFSGICIFCTDLMNGIPPIVRHYVQHVVSVREVMVFVTVRILPVRSVLPEERFLVDKLDHVGVYRCILQYGYMDNHNIDDDNFVVLVVASLKKIAENDHEIALLDSAFTNETTFVLGRTILKMSAKHNCFKRFVVNELYRFLQKNFRSNMSSLKIAHGKALQVGMLYEI